MKTPAILITALFGGLAISAQAQADFTGAPPDMGGQPIINIVVPDDSQAMDVGPADMGQGFDPMQGGMGGRQQRGGRQMQGMDYGAGATRAAGPTVSRGGMVSRTGRAPGRALAEPSANSGTNAVNGDKISLNFVNAPLDDVLRYMADAAHFIVILDAQIRTTVPVTVQSADPLTREEALALLNKVLIANGYTAVNDEGRFLTIMTSDAAKRMESEVIVGSRVGDIPNDLKVVTQILPCGGLTAAQLVRDLAPLMPTDSTMIANEAGNALIITDTRRNIRRLADLVAKLSSVTTAVNSIRIFPLEYADAKTIATVIKDLFPDVSSGGASGGGGGRGGRGGGGGGGMNPMQMLSGIMGGNAGSTTSSASKAATRVLVTTEDNNNALIVSARMTSWASSATWLQTWTSMSMRSPNGRSSGSKTPIHMKWPIIWLPSSPATIPPQAPAVATQGLERWVGWVAAAGRRAPT